MATVLITLVSTLQASFSAYNLYLASISIQNLQSYEPTAKKAAKHFDTAANQLWKTRATQASSTLAILFSFASSATMIVKNIGMVGKLLVVLGNVGVLVATREHVGDFWKGKAKIPLPGTGEYNEAIGKTQEIRLNMLYLIGTWGLVGLLALFP